MMSSLNLWPIGNCQASALIDGEAGLVWGCVPRFDGDPVFCALLDDPDEGERPRGEWRLALEDQVGAEQRYLRNTAVLLTRLEDAQGGAVEIRDFCPRFQRSGRMFRPVAFIRLVTPVAGSPRLKIRLAPARNWGAREPERTFGTNHIRYLTGDHPLRLTGDVPVAYILEERSFRVEEPLHMFLGPDEPFLGNVAEVTESMLGQTVKYWCEWVRGLAIPLEWQTQVIRAAIALKLCQYEQTGAIVAALTSSIPEAPNSGRNWDYRYCWLRDAYYTVQALNRLGALDILEKYLAYLRNLVDSAESGHIQPLYSLSGEEKLEEREAEALPGYRGMGPVRVGNAAWRQVQHDAYGQIVLSNVQAFFDERLFRKATLDDFLSLERVGDLAWKTYKEPDASLWEFRTREAIHTYSSVMSWAACDRLAKTAEVLGREDRAKHWRKRAAAIRKTIEARAWNEEKGHYAASFDGADLDASLLQLVEMRYLDPGDEKFLATFEAVEAALRRGQHMLRYEQEDDFGAPETAFNFCTFWLIEALHLVGREEEARSIFSQMLERLTPAGLLSEDIDFETGELWGNYPQTYSLVGLVNCAVLLSKPWNTIR
ncbi:MAG: glycoside hydrolase family 15 protein [Sphingomonadaceae bacterium]